MTRAAVVERPLDPAALLAEVSRTANGAAVLFVGTVRDVAGGRPVSGLDYRAYLSMAERELLAIVDEVAVRWETSDVVCEHRIGELELGEASIVIAAAHPHRAQAFAACREVIEEVKRRVPIWKRERYVDGAWEWVGQGAGSPAPEEGR